MTESIEHKIENLRIFFDKGSTRPIDFRLKQLKQLKATILAHQSQIEQALWHDLHKSPEESYLTEISIVLGEINYHIKHLKGWAKAKKIHTPLHLRPSSSKLFYQPLGLALIIAPWNYPFQLMLNPLIGAISAGCCALLKTSPNAPATAKVLEQIIRLSFSSSHVDIMHGNREINSLLLKQKYDIIFFTGSPRLGKIVHQAAAQHLTPTILELGGKSPCIVDSDANIAVSSKRIAWGKWLNAGQTCVAPDYLLVHSSIKEQLIEKIIEHTKKMYGDDAKQSPYYPRIISHSALERLSSLLKGEQIYYGGEICAEQKYIAPTIVLEPKADSAIMSEEIFGPLLPIITYDDINQALEYINQREKPLALYYFGKKHKHIINSTCAGGSCINDTIMHVSNHHLPFGGVGNSGMGRYHGKDSFLAFSTQRAVMKTPVCIDLPIKYVPFKFFNIVKRLI